MERRGETDAPQGTQSVIRAVRILKAVSRAKEEVSLVELCSELGLSKPTVHRILSALISEELVVQDAASRSFRIGPGRSWSPSRPKRAKRLRWKCPSAMKC